MSDWIKLLIGAGITTLVAWAAHAAGGKELVNSLEGSAQKELSATGVEGVNVTMYRDGALSRVGQLSANGEIDNTARASAEAAVIGVPGVSAVRWDDGSPNVLATGAGSGWKIGGGSDGATPENVAQCQTGVDNAIDGKSINFRSGSPYLSPKSLVVVDAVAGAMKACDDLYVAVGGHTDSKGSADVNAAMSAARAEAVGAALAERGIAAARISAKGYGATQPIEGASAEQNRRIEFTISAQAAVPANADKGE